MFMEFPWFCWTKCHRWCRAQCMPARPGALTSLPHSMQTAHVKDSSKQLQLAQLEIHAALHLALHSAPHLLLHNRLGFGLLFSFSFLGFFFFYLEASSAAAQHKILNKSRCWHGALFDIIHALAIKFCLLQSSMSWSNVDKIRDSECLHLGVGILIFIPISSVRGACEGMSKNSSQVPGAGNCMKQPWSITIQAELLIQGSVCKSRKALRSHRKRL